MFCFFFFTVKKKKKKISQNETDDWFGASSCWPLLSGLCTYMCFLLLMIKHYRQESVMDLTRDCRKSNGTTGQSDSNFQAKPPKMNGIGIGTNGSKQRNLSKDNGTKNSCNGTEDGDSLTEKSSSKRRQSTEEASVQREKTCKRNHDGQLSEMNGDSKIPKKMSQQCVKKEENKTEGPNNKKIDNDSAKHKPVKELHKCKRNIVEANRIEIPLPQGIELNSVAAIDIHADDVGHALQFLEFCEAFRQVDTTYQ